MISCFDFLHQLHVNLSSLLFGAVQTGGLCAGEPKQLDKKLKTELVGSFVFLETADWLKTFSTQGPLTLLVGSNAFRLSAKTCGLPWWMELPWRWLNPEQRWCYYLPPFTTTCYHLVRSHISMTTDRSVPTEEATRWGEKLWKQCWFLVSLALLA